MLSEWTNEVSRPQHSETQTRAGTKAAERRKMSLFISRTLPLHGRADCYFLERDSDIGYPYVLLSGDQLLAGRGPHWYDRLSRSSELISAQDDGETACVAARNYALDDEFERNPPV